MLSEMLPTKVLATFALCTLAIASCGDSGPTLPDTVGTDTLGTDTVRLDTGNVFVDFCSQSLPVWLAYRPADGDWTQVAANAEGTFELTPAERTEVAFVTWSGAVGGYATVIWRLAENELRDRAASPCRPDSGSVAVSVPFSGTQNQMLRLALGGRELTGYSPASMSVAGLSGEAVDLVVTSESFALGAFAGKVIVRRNVQPSNGGTLPVLNFDGSEAVPMFPHGLTVSGENGENSLAHFRFTSARGASLSLPLDGGSTLQGIPAAQLQSGDVHQVDVFAVNCVQTSCPDHVTVRYARKYYADPVDQVLALGPAVAPATITTAGSSPNLRARVEMAVQAEYSDLLHVDMSQGGGVNRSLDMYTSAAFAGVAAGGAWDATVPDLSMAPGFETDWGMSGAAAAGVYVRVWGGPVSLLVGGRPRAGDALVGAQDDGPVVP